MVKEIMEQFVNIIFTLIPPLVVVAWIAISALVVWTVVKFLKKRRIIRK
jgi:hypothetical protein